MAHTLRLHTQCTTLATCLLHDLVLLETRFFRLRSASSALFSCVSPWGAVVFCYGVVGLLCHFLHHNTSGRYTFPSRHIYPSEKPDLLGLKSVIKLRHRSFLFLRTLSLSQNNYQPFALAVSPTQQILRSSVVTLLNLQWFSPPSSALIHFSRFQWYFQRYLLISFPHRRLHLR